MRIGPLSALFAATYPERTTALVLYGALPRFTWAPGFPWGPPLDEYLREAEELARTWGTYESAAEVLASQKPDPTEDEIRFPASRQRLSASPGAVDVLQRMNAEIDVRGVLPTIRVPTLVVHRAEDHIPIEGACWMAAEIPGARFIELPGGPHFPHYGDTESLLREIESFAAGIFEERAWEEAEPDRVLATVLFTDIVGASERAAELGDRAWRDVLERHHGLVRRQLARFRGVEVDTAGDGWSRRQSRISSPDRVSGSRTVAPMSSRGSQASGACLRSSTAPPVSTEGGATSMGPRDVWTRRLRGTFDYLPEP